MLNINPYKYARIPASVLFDVKLTPEDKTVYCALAFKEKDGMLESGLRFIGDLLGISRNRVKRSIERLVKFEHVARSIAKRGDRSQYVLRSPIFSGKGSFYTGRSAVVSSNVSPKRQSKPCPKCHKPCFQILKAGWCRACAWEFKVGRVFDRKMVGRSKTA